MSHEGYENEDTAPRWPLWVVGVIVGYVFVHLLVAAVRMGS